jgi:ParB family transcriptional regulator, chromosome partitioning protein
MKTDDASTASSGQANTAILNVKLSVLHTRKGSRSVTPRRVAELAESIEKIGLQCPIIVRRATHAKVEQSEPAMEIVAGRHRFEAFLLLNRETIPAVVRDVDDLHADLINIDENLCRSNLTPAQTAAAIAKRKQIYEALYPQTAHGGDRKSSRRIGDLKRRGTGKRFTKATAEATGRPERTIQRAARQGEKIGPEELERIANTSLDKSVELEALAARAPEERKALIDRAVAGEAVSARVGAKARTSSDQWRSAFQRLIEEAPTIADCEWATEQLIQKREQIAALEIPGFLSRTPKG